MNYDAGLPSNVQYEAFCEPRIREIKALDKHLGACEHGQRAFQKLPRNMQRRNVSYNPQRLPRYLREKHKREVGYNIKINKRPSRKYRRRPANLLAEYNRRQKSEIWLETHIWHAKRFQMIRKWGYVLPKTPTFKSYRASIRAATESCLVQ
ncbi:Ribonucleases P/MRP protein subunit POP1, partial [Armadillidium nasatum]